MSALYVGQSILAAAGFSRRAASEYWSESRLKAAAGGNARPTKRGLK